MKTFRIVIFTLITILISLSACSSGGDDSIEPSTPPEVIKPEITIDTDIISSGLSFNETKSENTLTFTTNTDWSLSIAETRSGTSWCTASPTSGGKGTANVKFSTTENTSYEDRSVTVTIKAGTSSKTFTITQKAADALLVTTTKYEVSKEGGQIEIEVKSNIDYQMVISETAKEWIAESGSKGRTLKTHKHILEIAPNEDANKREGQLIFKSGNKAETVKIYQEGEAVLLLSQNEYIVNDAGETISVDIKSNVEYDVQMPDVDWIKEEASNRSMSSHTLKYVVAPNEDYDNRSTEIIFYDKNSELKDTLKVIQVQKDGIIVAKNEYAIEAVGGDLKFDVNTNVDLKVETSVDWIKQNKESRGLEAKPLSFTIAENTADEAREGLITISSGQLKQEIKVIQKEKPTFSVSETQFNVESAGGEIKVIVSTNGEYTIAMPKIDWLTEIKSRTTSTHTHTFTVSANHTYNTRETEIAFTHKETNEIIKVKVAQAQKDAIVISQKEYQVKAEGEIIEVKLSANVNFEVTMPDVDWISQTESRALTEHILYFKIAENTGSESRNATISFAKKDSKANEQIVITQQGKEEVSLDSNIQNNGLKFKSQSTKSSVSFTTNADWTLTVKPATTGTIWCIPSATSGNKGYSTVTFTILENESIEDRNATVTITCGTASKSFVIIQEGQDPVLTLTKNEYDVSDVGETISVTVKSNVSFDIQIPDGGWIKQVENARTLVENKLYFQIGANNGQARNAKVIFTNKELNLSTYLLVKQKAAESISVGSGNITDWQDGNSNSGNAEEWQ